MKSLSGWEAARCDEHPFRAKIKVSTLKKGPCQPPRSALVSFPDQCNERGIWPGNETSYAHA